MNNLISDYLHAVTDQAERKQREGERGAARASDHMRTVRELEQQYEASIGAKDGIYIIMMLLLWWL